MEYCDEGTLEEVSRLGLQEHVIRLYSKQITVAINVLHEHGIVHRDIKGQPTLPGLPEASRALRIVGAPAPHPSCLERNTFAFTSSAKSPTSRNCLEHVSTDAGGGPPLLFSTTF